MAAFFAFAWCCSDKEGGADVQFAEVTEAATPTFRTSPTKDEARPIEPQAASDFERQETLEQVMENLEPQAAEKNGQKPTTPAEKQAEKERLRQVTTLFIQAALDGQPCQWLDPTEGAKPQECIYVIDKTLSVFAIKANGDTLQSFDILNMQDVSSNGAGTPFADIQDTYFVCVSIKGDGSAESPALQHTGLLLPDATKQEEFCSCMKIVKKMRGALSPRQQAK